MQGHVTSSYYSANMGHSIAWRWLKVAIAVSGRLCTVLWPMAAPLLQRLSVLCFMIPKGSAKMSIRRSFADYVAQWLLDAGAEFGCRVEQG